jgi:hypothetical protein
MLTLIARLIGPLKGVRTLVAVFVTLSIVCQGTLVLAGTTGGLSISVVDPTTNQPISGAKVGAASPSQIASGVTDASGHVNFLDLAPDTYTVSVEVKGYEPSSLSGVTVVADNTRVVPFSPNKEKFREIGRVSARAASSLVKPGTTADVYSINPVVQAKVAAAGGGGNLDSAWSALATVPGVAVAPGQQGYIGAGATGLGTTSLSIRGGDYDQIGYEIDGVPVNRAFDNYPSGPVSSLGQQELQVYTGTPPANSTSEGISGYINQVMRTGTQTPFESVTIGQGGPAYYHKVAVELGGETANGRLSYYVGIGGYNQDYRFVDQFNGAGVTNLDGITYAVPCAAGGTAIRASGCTGPYTNSLVLGGPQLFLPSSIADRDNDVNLHYYFPHKDGSRDDIQALFMNNYLDTSLYSSTNDQGGAAYLAAVGVGVPAYSDGYQLNLPTGGFLPSSGLASLVTPYYFPNTPTHQFDGPIAANEEDGELNNQAIEKLQFTKSLGSNAYARIYGYSYFSDWLNTGPNSNYVPANVGIPGDYELTAHTRGLSLQLADQINAQNLVQLGADYTTSSVLRTNNTEYLDGGSGVSARTAIGVLVDSSHPTNGICYAAGGTPTPCFSSNTDLNGSGVGAFPAAQYATFGQIEGLAGAGTFTPASGTCGGGACQYLVIGNGQYATYNQVKPTFTGASLTDEFRPTSRLTINGGIRFDDYSYQGADTSGGNARAFFYNAYNQEECVSRTTHLVVDKVSDLGLAGPSAACPSGYSAANFTNPSGVMTQGYSVFQPRLGFTYSVDPQTVIRAAYGRYAEPPNSAFEQYNFAQSEAPATLYGTYGFQQYGFTTPDHPIPPATSNNYDFSIEHQFPQQIAVKLTPFIRKTQNQVENFYLNRATNFVSGLNVGSQTSRGFEFELDKGNFAQPGLSAKLSFAYTNSYITYNTLSNGSTVLTPVVNAINAYNAFTKAGGGSPCYTVTVTGPAGNVITPGGAPSASCGAGTQVNPYYNQPEQSTSGYTSGSSYVPYTTVPAGIGLDAAQIGFPYVASLVLNEKVNKFSITPVIQMFAGQRYGDPLATNGFDPTACTIVQGATSVSCGTDLAGGIPNTATGKFDSIGEFVNPTQVLLHLQLSYDVSKNFSLTANLANVLNECFGGSNEPWNVKGSCGYIYPNGGLTGAVGNTNLGQPAQPIGASAYTPTYTQQPFGIFISGNFKL